MVTYLREEFDEMLDKDDWMNSQTKGEAHKKLQMLRVIVGYPNELRNDTRVNHYYSKVCIKLLLKSSFFRCL